MTRHTTTAIGINLGTFPYSLRKPDAIAYARNNGCAMFVRFDGSGVLYWAETLPNETRKIRQKTFPRLRLETTGPNDACIGFGGSRLAREG